MSHPRRPASIPVAGLVLALLLPALLPASVTVLRSDERGVVLRYEPGACTLVTRGDGARAVECADGDNLARPGEADLPSRSVRVGLPQTGGFRLSLAAGGAATVDGVELGTVPFFSWDRDTGWTGRPGAGPVPAALARARQVEQFRGVRFVTIELSPCQYDPAARRLSTVKWLEVTVAFDSPPRNAAVTDRADRLCRSFLVNGQEAHAWQAAAAQGAASFFERSDNWVKIEVESTGVYGVTGRDLEAAGVPLTGLDPATLALYTVPEHVPNDPYPDTMIPVPLRVEGGDDGRLDEHDRLVFYGLGAEHWLGRCSVYVKNYYTRDNVYWLTWGGGPGVRIPEGMGPDTAGARTVRFARDVKHVEKDLDCPARSGLLWMWSQMYKGADQDLAAFETELGLDYPSEVTRLSGRLIVDSAGSDLEVCLNHRPVATFVCGPAPASQPFTFEVDTVLPAAYTSNTLRLELRGTGAKRVYVDCFDVEYRRRLSLAGGQLHFLFDDTTTCRYVVRDVHETPLVLDVTDPYAPRSSVGYRWGGDSLVFCHRRSRPGELVVCGASQLRRPSRVVLRRPGRLRSAAVQADYWVVAPAEFAAAAGELARYRDDNIAGLAHGRAAVAVLEDIYDDYAFGRAEPVAIKRFFADKRPLYGLLAGDATCDYKNFLGRARPGVPAYEVGFGLNPDAYDRTMYCCDAWYADFEGDGTSPDMMLGRITARSATELRQYKDKLAAYETGPAGSWAKRYLLLADDEFLGDPNRPDIIGFGHIGYCEAMAALSGNLLDLVKVYLTEYPYVGVRNKPGARAELLRQLDRGALLMVFFGHGSGFDLTHESVLNIAGVPQIRNGGRTPFCFFGSCSVGRFDDTQFECIAEELARLAGSGSVASVGATKATTAGSNQVFARNLLVPLFENPDSTIGSAFLRAWPTDPLYHLFGDPAAVLRLPRPSTQELFVAPDTLRPGAAYRMRGLIEQPQGSFEWSLAGPVRSRTYRSTRGEVVYPLPGLEVGRGTGMVHEGELGCRGTFPVGVPLDTVFVGNGWYAPVPQSARLSASVWGPGPDLGVLRDTIAWLDQPAATRDRTGPAVSFAMNGHPLADGATVPADFDLDVAVFDPSGIFIAPVTGSAPEFFVDNRQSATDIEDELVFDDSSSTTARFRQHLSLAGPVDSVFVLCSDNLLNRTTAGIRLHPVGTDVLHVDSTLVYPNPAASDCRFTFVLSRAALVHIRIYSLAGRLVRDLGESAGDFGFNQVYWDGRDGTGARPANGVYLFVLKANSEDPGGARQSVTVRDRLVLRH